MSPLCFGLGRLPVRVLAQQIQPSAAARRYQQQHRRRQRETRAAAFAFCLSACGFGFRALGFCRGVLPFRAGLCRFGVGPRCLGRPRQFRFTKLGLDRFEVLGNTFGQRAGITRPVGGFQFQAVFGQRDQFSVCSAGIETLKAVAQPTARGQSEYLHAVVTDVRRASGENFTEDRS
ncbi:MAG: hypothetical protein U0935_25250 [Pirellulales bacterium]